MSIAVPPATGAGPSPVAPGPAELLHRLRARTPALNGAANSSEAAANSSEAAANGSSDAANNTSSAANRSSGPVTHVERVPARVGRPAPWPLWVPDQLRDAFIARGVTAPWEHQTEAAELAFTGRHVALATGTASGKSLAYQLPALTRLLTDARATVLYLSPTKALAADQLRAVARLGLDQVRAAGYDGDTPREEREWIRQHARFVLTNPDMLHYAMLPAHARWSTFLRRLAYVVVDECHTYRGVFGSHVAHVLRRLRRVATRYGSTPVFVLTSATSGDPAGTASRLIGLPVSAVTEDASPRGAMTFALWEPPLLPPPDHPNSPNTAPPNTALPDTASRETSTPAAPAAAPSDTASLRAETHDRALRDAASFGVQIPFPRASTIVQGPAALEGGLPAVRRSALRETADLLADAVIAGTRTLAFVRSRRGAEVVATMTRRMLDQAVPGLGDRVAAYRGGYLKEDRRAIERALLSGELLGLASTNALELGVDLVGLDAVLICGYPGTRASLWQQAGRAGRSGGEALAVLVARDDPLDTYLVHHPEALFGRPVEATVLDPTNPYVLGPQLCCAASEAPLTADDLALFGGAPAVEAVESLTAAGVLRRRPSGWYWTHRSRPEVDLRGTGGTPVAVVEAPTGRLLGTVDPASSHFMLHAGAIYLHQGTSYLVDELDLADSVALVHAAEPDWSTHARDVTNLSVVSVRSYVDAGPVGLFLGEVDVSSQVVSYQRRRIGSGEVIDTRPLDLPVRELRTVAVWFTIADSALAAAGVEQADVPGALHAAEHAAIGLLPLMATCDRWDIGGLSTACHADTDSPTVFVYDGHPGGAGFAERAYATAAAWLRATREAIVSCGCEAGCPSCVQSPKCGNGNHPLAKDPAVSLLDAVLAALPALHTPDQPAPPNQADQPAPDQPELGERMSPDRSPSPATGC